jgi:type II secretory pathway component GspD/PulD (secretin)
MRKDWHVRALLSAALTALLAPGPTWAQSAAAPAKGVAAAPVANASAPKMDAKRDAKLARQAFNRGEEAERKGDLLAALGSYDEAVRQAPQKTAYRIRLEAVRFALIQQHTERAERDAVAGRANAARKELRAAVALDPGYRTAQERLQQLERQSLRESDRVGAFATAPARLKPRPGTRTIDFRGDVRGAYGEIARQFGLTAAFDEDILTRSIRVRLDEVDFPTAMRLLGQQTKTFWRALDSQTFFVFNDTPEKRKEYLPFIERTIVLPESERPEQMNEMLRLVREFSGLTHAQLETATRTITVRGSEPDVALASELVRELEQSRGEIMLEVEILEVQRNAAQRLGITPPSRGKAVALSSADLKLAQQSTEGLVTVLERLFGTPSSLGSSSAAQIASLLATGGVGLGSLIPPLIAFGGGKTTFLATLPGASADFADTLSAVRGARRVLLRAKDGEPATFFVGDRFPISLATLSSNFGGQGLVPNVRVENFATGLDPASVVVATFRTSGHLDLATANAGSGANTVSILLGNGDGTFSANTDIVVGTTPVALTAADFGNGHVDLAVANQGSNSVSILLGNGDGTFQARTDIPVGTQPSALVVGDFDKDGHLDLAVANQGSNSVSILFGNGNGTFQPAVNIPLTNGTGPASIATADFDKDTNPDLVTANSTSNTVTVLFGNGTRTNTFPVQTDIIVGTKPLSVVTADFNTDGDPDLAVANEGSDSVSILLGRGTRTNPFSTRTDLTLATGSQPSALLPGDFNGDGHADLAIADTGTGAVTILFGAGDGTFAAHVDFSTASQPSALASGDFNGDSLLDLAIANGNASSLTVILNSNMAALNQSGQLPYPSVEFEDIGLKVKATPHIHPGSEVTLHMEMEIRSLSASTFNSIPVISNRSVDETVRLKINERSILAGIFNLQRLNSISGLPGAATASIIGYAAGLHNPQDQETELIIVITPRLLRPATRLDRARYLGPGGEPATGATETNEPNP